MKLFHYLLATGGGVGFFPLAPGTAGSILILILTYLFYPIPTYLYIAILTLLFFVGVYSSAQVEKERGHDPSIVVIDEIVGMGLGLLFLPQSFILFFIAFVLFRLFDIFKPPPIHTSQKIPAGWGIMLDDVIAGIYTLISVHLIRFFVEL